jgi:hypothetical protein
MSHRGYKSMALETLRGVEEIGGFKVVDMDALREQYPQRFSESGAMDYRWFEKSIRPTRFIHIRHDKNSISFTLQKGPVKEVGLNGCQVDTLIHVAKRMLEEFQNMDEGKYRNRHNAIAITKLEEAIHRLDDRSRERVERGVEGTSQP